jgi:hypothetical protein
MKSIGNRPLESLDYEVKISQCKWFNHFDDSFEHQSTFFKY